MTTVRQIITSSVAATSAMTAFSYLLSEQKEENFREPQLLAGFVGRNLNIPDKTALPVAWVAHYLIGTGFTTGYSLIQRQKDTKPTAKNGLCYGAMAGCVGVLVWKTLFDSHTNPPKTHRKGFYAQLLVTHLIFGLTLSAFKRRKL